jgi:dCTP deaminase
VLVSSVRCTSSSCPRRKIYTVILSDREIAGEVKSHNLGITPFDEKNLQPASYDLRLDRHFRKFGKNLSGTRLVDPADPTDLTIPYEMDKIGLEPGGFLLASTVEHVRIPRHLVARVEGKSSLARLGLFVHVTAGFIDPGFDGHITLELYCGNGMGLWLYAGMPIAQIAFERMSTPPSSGYSGKYQGSNEPGPVPSRYHLNFPLEEL